jgi:DNA-binding Lrp family transcriptional regulator
VAARPTLLPGPRIEYSRRRGETECVGGVLDTWTTLDLPLLRLTVEEIEAGGNPEFEDLALKTGIDSHRVWDRMKVLRDAGYVEAAHASMPAGFVLGVTARARRTVGAWPSADTFVNELIQALAQAADREPDEARKGWLRAVGSGMAGVGRAVFTAELEGILRRYGVLL